MLNLTIKQERTGPVAGCHPWVFSGAFKCIPDGIKPGTPVNIQSENGDFLAKGYFGSYSQIAVRIWGYDKNEEIDEAFFIRRVERAYSIRRRFVESPDTNAYRLINGENDLLPGLVVDRYADYLVIQCHTRGIEAWKKEIVASLEKVIRPLGIYERSDMEARGIEDLEKTKGLVSGAVPELITIRENGFSFLVDVKCGQKTGFFLDQRDKRKALIKYADNASLLNTFSYTGGFSTYALAGGARHVISIDSSDGALELAKENIRINDFDMSRCEFICGDVKNFLRNEKRFFDVIILDPPAFIKDRKKKKEGMAGYRGINEGALRILVPDGILLTCSCSAHLRFDEFRYILSEAGLRAGRVLTFLETYTHGIDHLQLVPFLEGEYLKCFFISAGAR
jgi:23S rRNA (cytosine1962-C5)-methyltransferase